MTGCGSSPPTAEAGCCHPPPTSNKRIEDTGRPTVVLGWGFAEYLDEMVRFQGVLGVVVGLGVVGLGW